LPAILHWEQNHFVVIVPGSKKNKIIIADPGKKYIITLTQKEFNEKWLSHANEAGATGIALLLEPGPSFYEQSEDSNKTIGWKMLLGQLQQHLGITIGNPDAENTIIKVCNPYCGPCRKAHPILDEIISKYNIKIQIIFYVDEDEPELIVTQHLLAINAELNQAKTIAALHDWYLAPTKNFDAFSKKYPVSVELDKYTSNIKEMNSWCIESEVKETPTFFINKSKFPNEYLVKDLAYLIENILYKI